MKIIYIGNYDKGSLKIELGDIIITQHYDYKGELKNSLICSGYLLAWWFVSSWESLIRDEGSSTDLEWKMNHMMAAIGNGYLWPPLIFIGEGDYILISSKKTQFYINEVIDYKVSKSSFIEEVSKFIENIINQLEYSEAEHQEIKLWWRDVKKIKLPN